MKKADNQNICCHPFNSSLWDEKTHVWKNKLFLQDDVRQVFHIPLNIATVITRMFKKIESAKAIPDEKDFLLLAYDPSPWKSELYMTVKRNIPDGRMARISGRFFSKVYDGPYHMVTTWIRDMNRYLDSRREKALKYYFHYAYCPKCAQKYGHNYCVAFAQIAPR